MSVARSENVQVLSHRQSQGWSAVRAALWLVVRSFCLWRFRGVSDGLSEHLVGGQHRPDEQQWKNYLPRKLGGGEGYAEESR